MSSPKFALDQDYTKKAIEEFQMYLNKYPAGDNVTNCNNYISELRKKLEKKAFFNARLYFNIEEYKAAVIAFKNFLNDYPDSDYREEVMFLIVKSGYLLAYNSVKKKQFDRFESVISDYYTYLDEYPSGKYLGDVEKYYTKSQDYISKVAN